MLTFVRLLRNSYVVGIRYYKISKRFICFDFNKTTRARRANTCCWCRRAGSLKIVGGELPSFGQMPLGASVDYDFV